MSFNGSAIVSLLDGAVSNGILHGVAAVAVSRDGQLFHHAAGEAGERSLFRNASMTKAVATTAALQLVERGLLSLDATVESILPEFGRLSVLEGFDGGRPLLRAPASRATVRQLVTHTAGFGYFFLNEKLRRYHSSTGVPTQFSGSRRCLIAPMVNDPGTAWEYGGSTDWLGRVVEAVSGQRLGDFLRQNIYGPLGMVDSTFAPSEEQRARMMRVMQRQPDGSLVTSPYDFPAAPDWDAAGHGSYGTVQDYGRFIQAWLNDGEPILGPATAAAAFHDQLSPLTLPTSISTVAPELSNDMHALPVPRTWGLGFHLVLADLPGMRRRGTGDWASLFNSYYWIDRSTGVGGVLMTQLLPLFDASTLELMMGFEAAVYEQIGAGAATAAQY